MEVGIVHNRPSGVSVTIDCPKVDEDIKRLKTHIESFDSRIKGMCNGNVVYVDICDIYYFDAVDNRTFLYTEKECFEVGFRLYELEEILAGKDFIRISKSQIANIRKMRSLLPQLNRTILVTLENDEDLSISRRYVKSIKEKLGI